MRATPWCPTCWSWRRGEQDAFLQRGLAVASLELCQDAGALFFPEAGHWVHLEVIDAVDFALAKFFAGEPGDEWDPLRSAFAAGDDRQLDEEQPILPHAFGGGVRMLGAPYRA